MNAMKIHRAALRAAGVIVTLAALAHVGWHFFLPGYGEMQGVTDGQWHFLALLNLSIALLLVFMAAVTFGVAASRAIGIHELRAFTWILLATWSIRFVLEVVLPVRIPFLVVPGPSGLLKVLMLALLAILAVPEVLLRAGVARVIAPGSRVPERTPTPPSSSSSRISSSGRR